jgi:hypothetical protein
MDSTTLLLLVVPLVLGLIFNAVKFMRFIGFVTGARRKTGASGRLGDDDHLSFEERVAERLRDLDRENRRSEGPSNAHPAPQEFGRRRA